MEGVNQRRRKSDRPWFRPRENGYRDLWLVLITGFVVWTAVLTYDNTVANKRGLRATCAATSAVIDAGRATLRSGAVLNPPAFRSALEKLGLPRTHDRIIQSNRAARLYGLQIARAVERSTGQKGLARPDGSLDCERLAHP